MFSRVRDGCRRPDRRRNDRQGYDRQRQQPCANPDECPHCRLRSVKSKLDINSPLVRSRSCATIKGAPQGTPPTVIGHTGLRNGKAGNVRTTQARYTVRRRPGEPVPLDEVAPDATGSCWYWAARSNEPTDALNSSKTPSLIECRLEKGEHPVGGSAAPAYGLDILAVECRDVCCGAVRQSPN